MKKIVSLLLALMMIVSLAVPAFATSADQSAGAGSVNFQKSKKVTITPALSNLTPTDLFGEFKNVMPGDRLSETVTIKNWAVNYDYVKVYIQAKKHDASNRPLIDVTAAENYDFLSKLTLTVTDSKGNQIYKAAPNSSVRLDDEGDLKNAVYLGTLDGGKSMKLNVQLEVPITLDNTYANAMGEVDWIFYYEAIPYSSDSPKTGDYIIMTALTLMVLSGAALAILLIAKKRKNRK